MTLRFDMEKSENYLVPKVFEPLKFYCIIERCFAL